MKIESNLNFNKNSLSNIFHFRLILSISYEIYPNLIANLKKINPNLINKTIMDDKFEFNANYLIGDIEIHGKIILYDFGVESITIFSNNGVKFDSKNCHLNGIIQTGLVVNEKNINNIKSSIKRSHKSCKMDADWYGYGQIKIKFTFKFKFELDQTNYFQFIKQQKISQNGK